MKKLIVICLTLLLFSSCQTRSYHNHLIVEKIEMNGFSEQYLHIGSYKVTIVDEFNGFYLFNHAIYTDSLYQPGDTIKLTK